MAAVFNGLTGFNPVLSSMEFWCPCCKRKFLSITRGLQDALDKLFEGQIHFDGRYFYCPDCLNEIFKTAKLPKDDNKNYIGHINYAFPSDDEEDNLENEEENNDE